MRIGNPSVRRWVAKSQQGKLGVEVQPATYGGVIKKTLLFAAVTLLSAISVMAIFYGAIMGKIEPDILVLTLVGVLSSAIPMLIVSLIITFVPSTVKVLGFVYAVMQGALLGVVAFVAELAFPGVAWAALLGTVIVFVLCIVLNKMLSVRVKSSFVRGMLIAMISFIFVELIWSILAFTGVYNISASPAFLWIQLALSVFCIVWATVMVLFDLQCVDDLVNYQADKRYEWNVAFALVTTLVYLYLEILELLVRLLAIFGKRK